MTFTPVKIRGDDPNDDCNCILYELLVYSEWKQEPEVSKLTKSGDTITVPPQQRSYINIFNYVRKPSPTSDVLRLIRNHLPWKFAVGEGGKVVAILQDTVLEIRASRDEYSSVVGKAVVNRDPVPQWRKMVWSPDSSMLAMAHSSGEIAFYNLLGSNMFNIKPGFLEKEKSVHPLVDILFLKPRLRSKKWAFEFIAVDYNGNLCNYLVSPTDGYDENHSFSFAAHYVNGVTAVGYHQSHNLLFVSGITGVKLYDGITEQGSSVGLTVWRLLNDTPYYQLAISSEEEHAIWKAQRSLWNWVPLLKKQSDHTTIFRMQPSPKGKLLVCLHSDGAISVWHLPSMRIYRYWRLHDQPDFNVKNPQLSSLSNGKRYNFNYKQSDSDFYPVDANWWSEKEVIIARFSGSVSVCSVRSLNNLLGESPEFLAGPPQVSALCGNRGFLGLECESFLSSKKFTEGDEPGPADSESSDEEEESSLLRKTSYVLRTGVYMITDMERFQPKRKKPKLLYRTYRLLALKSTTPEELYTRKIDNEEYGEALALAKAYNLDCDLVYQRQWRNSAVSIATIHDYLSKITKRSWVLKECIDRVPETFAAAIELLEFGLKGINLETVLAVGEGTDGGHFILQHPGLDYDDDNGRDLIKIEEREKCLLTKIDTQSPSSAQKELLNYRTELLHYYDMLRTYEIIIGGPHLVDSHYDSSFYKRFRSTPLIISVVEFARDGNCEAVQHMFTYHGSAILPHWLPVLSSFPETMDPTKYQNILPECGVEGGVVLIEQAKLRKKGWFEDSEFRYDNKVYKEDGSDFLYEQEPDLKEFYCPVENLEPELITKWYKFQVCQIESRSGIVDYALNLLNLAKERNVMGLDDLYHDIKSLYSLVYEVNILNTTLSSLKCLSNTERAKLLMSKTTEETFVNDIKQILIPFLDRCEKQSQGIRMKLLEGYLVEISSNNLSLPHKLFEYLMCEPNSVIIGNVEDIINLGFTCVYASTHPDQLALAQAIAVSISKQPLGTLNEVFPKIQDKLHELKRQLSAAKVLNKNGIPKPVSYIRDIASNPSLVKQLLNRLARTFAKQIPPPSKSEWENLLADILYLHQQVFRCIHVKECYEIYAETLLSSGIKRNIQEAAAILECRKSVLQTKMVSFDRSVNLVLQVAREYFDSSGDLLDPAMDLAKTCLQLILDENELIQEQLDLISSLQILSDFGLSMLPLQVRQCEDRMKLVKSCLYKQPLAYRQWKLLLQMGHKLRACGRNTRECEGRVLTITAQSAFEAEDFEYCAEICKEIVVNNHGIGWQVAQQLGQCKEFSDVEQRCDFLSFAVLHCDPELLDSLLTTRCLLEAQVLHQQLSNYVAEESADLTSGDEEEFSDALTSPMTPQREFPPVTSIMKAVEGSTEVIRRNTYQLLRNVGNKNFWKDALSSWVQLGPQYGSSVMNDDQGEPLLLQAVPEFYISLCPACHSGLLDPQYNSFFPPDVAAINPALELCRALLRITLLEGPNGESSSKMDTIAVIVQLVKHLLPEDTTLGLAHLLLVTNISQAKECLDSLPATVIALQIACYYYSIFGYTAVYGSQREKPTIADVFLYSPTELISHMLHLVQNLKAQGIWANHLIQAYKTLSDFLQGQQLNNIGCGIDLKRFAVDKDYRRDSILGLPMTVDTKRFQLAVNLGSKHGIPVSEIAAIHASALLLNTEEISVTEQTKRLNDSQLLELLRKDPEVVCKRFESYVYPSIGGTQHNLLVLYYSVLSSVAENTIFYSLYPRDHIKLLKKLKATSPAIDYKLLVEEPNRFLDAVKPAMRKESVGLIVKLLKTLPPSLKCTVLPGAVFGAWAAIEFFQVSSNAYALGPRLWYDQIRACSHYFSKMAAPDVLNFAKEICFSEKSIDIMTIDCRITLLHIVKEYTDDRQKDNLGKEWVEASSTLNRWISHLHKVDSYQLEELNGNTSPELQLLLRQFDLSRGEKDLLKQVFTFCICSSVSLSTLEAMLKLFPQPSPSLEDMLEDEVNEAVSGLRNGPAPESLALLPRILLRLQEISADREYSLENVWTVLEPLCYDSTISPKLRLQAIQLFEKIFPPSDIRRKGLIINHIKAVLKISWSQNEILVSDSDFATEESETKLFLLLLGTAESWQQLKQLKNVLEFWPTFQNPVMLRNRTSDPWILLLYKILHFKGEHLDSVMETVEEICKEKELNEEALQQLVSQSQESVDLSLLLAVCLMSDHSSLHDSAVFLLRQKVEMGEVILNKRVMTYLLRRGLTADLVGTPLYSQLEQHLLAGSDKQLPPIFAVVAQLEEAGHRTEALTLSHRAAQLAGHQRGGSLLSGAVKFAREKWSQKKL